MREDIIYCGANFCTDLTIATQNNVLFFSKPESIAHVGDIFSNGTIGLSNFMFSTDIHDLHKKYMELCKLCHYVAMFDKRGNIVLEYSDGSEDDI
jgi:hypothetical protein